MQAALQQCEYNWESFYVFESHDKFDVLHDCTCVATFQTSRQ